MVRLKGGRQQDKYLRKMQSPARCTSRRRRKTKRRCEEKEEEEEEVMSRGEETQRRAFSFFFQCSLIKVVLHLIHGASFHFETLPSVPPPSPLPHAQTSIATLARVPPFIQTIEGSGKGDRERRSAPYYFQHQLTAAPQCVSQPTTLRYS